MTSYLFGDILSVSTVSLIYMAAFTVIVMAVFFSLYNPIILYLFDEDYASARGLNTRVLGWIVYIMLPVGIIVLIRIVGIILTIALMTIPVSIAKLFCKSAGRVIWLSMLISFAFCVAGLPCRTTSIYRPAYVSSSWRRLCIWCCCCPKTAFRDGCTSAGSMETEADVVQTKRKGLYALSVVPIG